MNLSNDKIDLLIFLQTRYQKTFIIPEIIHLCLKEGAAIFLVLFHSFVNHPKKYRLVEKDSNPTKARKVEFCLNSDIPSKMPKAVQELIKEMVC